MKELATALAKAQGLIEGAKKDSINPGFKSKYADLASVWDAIREPLSSNGLSVLQLVTRLEGGKVTLRTILLHVSGESIESEFEMPVSQPNNPQAVGSAITYARRYTLMALVGVAPEDDDGQAAAAGAKAPTLLGAEAATALQDAFDKARGLPAKTQKFMEAKGSNVEPGLKTALLKNMSETLKALKAAEESK